MFISIHLNRFLLSAVIIVVLYLISELDLTRFRDSSNFMQDLSDEARTIFEVLNYVFISGILSLLGITANVINIIIFHKQGFSNTSNIAFLGLAISDLCCLVAVVFASICMNPLLPEYGVAWVPTEVMYL